VAAEEPVAVRTCPVVGATADETFTVVVAEARAFVTEDDVADIVPLPDTDNDAPVPTTIAAALLVPDVIALNAVDPPPEVSRFIVFEVGVVIVTVLPLDVRVTSPISPFNERMPPTSDLKTMLTNHHI
jgi:hypothetical protein